jgi:hypothetical protein
MVRSNLKIQLLLWTVVLGMPGIAGSATDAAAPDCTGTSVFESAVEKAGGVIPDSLADIGQMIGQGIGASSLQETALEIPKGRSLQRDKSSFELPRKVIAYSAFDPLGSGFVTPSPGANPIQSQITQPTPVFIGHAPVANQLEVISLVPGKECYKFMLVQDFGVGKTPTLSHPSRGLCLQCHQNGAPIFPKFPWSETSFNSNVVDRMKAEKARAVGKRLNEKWDSYFTDGAPKASHPDFSLAGSLDAIRSELLEVELPDSLRAKIVSDLDSDPIVSQELSAALEKGRRKKSVEKADDDHKVSISLDANDGFGFDGAVRAANRAVQTRKVCDTVCGTQAECRKILLGAVFQPSTNGIFGSTSAGPSSFNAKLKALSQSKWDPQGFAYPSSVLPNRDPLDHEEEGGLSKIVYASASATAAAQNAGLDKKKLETVFGDKTALFLEAIQTQVQVGLQKPGVLNSYDDFASTQDVSSNTGELLRQYGIEGFADPKNPRPAIDPVDRNLIATTIGPLVGPACFGFNTSDIAKLASVSLDTLNTNLSKSTAVSKALESPVIDKDALINALIVHTGSSDKDEINRLACQDPVLLALIGGGPKKQIEKLDVAVQKQMLDIVPPKDKVLPYFTTYCSECHLNKATGIPIPLTSLGDLQTFVGSLSGLTVKQKLERQLMPPSYAKKKLPDTERLLMLKLLESPAAAQNP